MPRFLYHLSLSTALNILSDVLVNWQYCAGLKINVQQLQPGSLMFPLDSLPGYLKYTVAVFSASDFEGHTTLWILFFHEIIVYFMTFANIILMIFASIIFSWNFRHTIVWLPLPLNDFIHHTKPFFMTFDDFFQRDFFSWKISTYYTMTLFFHEIFDILYYDFFLSWNDSI